MGAITQEKPFKGGKPLSVPIFPILLKNGIGGSPFWCIEILAKEERRKPSWAVGIPNWDAQCSSLPENWGSLHDGFSFISFYGFLKGYHCTKKGIP